MIVFHLAVGSAVLLLNTLVAALVVVPRPGPRWWSLAAWAHGVLALQVASGFFLVTAAPEQIGALHMLLPAVALGGVAVARSIRGTMRSRAVGLASLAASGAGVFSLVTGLLH